MLGISATPVTLGWFSRGSVESMMVPGASGLRKFRHHHRQIIAPRHACRFRLNDIRAILRHRAEFIKGE